MSEKECRICFETKETVETGLLISPCLCMGTSKYIHQVCIEQCRKYANNPYECGICHFAYIMEDNILEILANEYWWLVSIFVSVAFFLGFFLIGKCITRKTKESTKESIVFASKLMIAYGYILFLLDEMQQFPILAPLHLLWGQMDFDYDIRICVIACLGFYFGSGYLHRMGMYVLEKTIPPPRVLSRPE
jgi:hypothetical protein